MEDKKKNPSRHQCEEIIRRILMSEVLEKGKNNKFKSASDFMPFFESLYLASPSLNKQVQRAVTSLALPKDENGYFIINKTQSQIDEDSEISRILKSSAASLSNQETEVLFLNVDRKYVSFLFDLIKRSSSFQGLFLTMIPSSDGILFLTSDKRRLSLLISSLL